MLRQGTLTRRRGMVVGAATAAVVLVGGAALAQTDLSLAAGQQPSTQAPGAKQPSASPDAAAQDQLVADDTAAGADTDAAQDSGVTSPDPTPSGSVGAKSPNAASSVVPGAGKPVEGPPGLAKVKVKPLERKKPVGLGETGRFGTGLQVQVVQVKAVDGEAKVQGEIAGPALRVVLQAKNNTKEPISLSRAQVEITYGDDQSPGVALSGPDLEAFPESVTPGKPARGAFVFGIPEDERDKIQIVVFYATDAPIVVFEGSAP